MVTGKARYSSCGDQPERQGGAGGNPMNKELIPNGPIMITAPTDGQRIVIHDLKNNLQKALAPGETCSLDLSELVDEPVIIDAPAPQPAS